MNVDSILPLQKGLAYEKVWVKSFECKFTHNLKARQFHECKQYLCLLWTDLA
jgi:hypothetical protein